MYPGRTNIVATLDKLHARHALPGFADRTAEEKEIEKLTTDITKVRSWFDIPHRTQKNFFSLASSDRLCFLSNPYMPVTRE